MTIRVVIVVFILLLPWFVVARGLLSGLGIAARNLLFWKKEQRILLSQTLSIPCVFFKILDCEL